jgi:Arc/MetJ-type ribon-helix-helix transcriptional regulator
MSTSTAGKYKGSGVFVKLPRGTLREIDGLVEKGDFLNRTHLVRRAVEQFLENTRLAKGKTLETVPPSGNCRGERMS